VPPRTEIGIDGSDFRINGAPTYAGRWHEGRRIEGLLLNSRMVQAIFDDANPRTRPNWAYPDTGTWDPDRNTRELCAMLPVYRAHGLLAITVGLQGGGSIYRPEIFEHYRNSAFTPEGELEPAYLERLLRVLEAADRSGMVVIVNYFYWKQQRFQDDAAVCRATEAATQWLLESGHRNILVDIKNEIREADDILSSRGIHRLLDIARSTTQDGRRLLVATSTHPEKHLPDGSWPALCDFFMPHGNNSEPDGFRRELLAFREEPVVAERARPICCNEDSIHVASLDAAIDAGASWGYYDQGYGSVGYHGRHDWSARDREADHAELSGFQTVPVNWSINTAHKRAFFDRVREVTGAGATP
jgi:hypothetical protein